MSKKEKKRMKKNRMEKKNSESLEAVTRTRTHIPFMEKKQSNNQNGIQKSPANSGISTYATTASGDYKIYGE